MTATITCPLTRDGLTFSMQTELVRCADPHVKGDMDEWSVTLTSDYPGEFVLTYRMGIGLRDKHGRPQKPSIESVLSCIGSDLQTARDLPDSTAEALDYLVDEFGGPEKPGECYRLLEALREQHDKARSFLKHTGVDVDHFADWCADLDR